MSNMPRSHDCAERFWAKVDLSGDCWLWTAGVNHHGYGVFYSGPNRTRAHRTAYELEIGPIPEGLVIDHLCRVPGCVNPAHLEAVTQAENNRRGLSRTAANALKASCPQGHAYTPSNTYVSNSGDRRCRTCNRVQARRYYHEAKGDDS